MSFWLYMLGAVAVLAGLVYGATLLDVPQSWIVVGVLIVVGLGVMSAVTRTRRRDPS